MVNNSHNLSGPSLLIWKQILPHRVAMGGGANELMNLKYLVNIWYILMVDKY